MVRLLQVLEVSYPHDWTRVDIGQRRAHRQLSLHHGLAQISRVNEIIIINYPRQVVHAGDGRCCR
jgi:hypothetical protein